MNAKLVQTKKKLINPRSAARIEYLKVENYRALRSVELKEITPLTVLLGPNGSGKSTIFDVFNFLAECFQHGLRYAWDRRGRGRELKTRGQDGPVLIELKYREHSGEPLITYHLVIDEEAGAPYVSAEWLQWRRKERGAPFYFMKYEKGMGTVIRGNTPDEDAQRIEVPLRARDLIAVNTLGQLAEHPRIAALRDFISDWYVSYLSIDDTRKQPEAGPQERLSKTGDNLPNVIQNLSEQNPERLAEIFDVLSRRVPRLEKVISDVMADGRLLLQIKDAPFDRPVMSRFSSDGTLKMLAYLVVLYDPDPPHFIGIEEPENFLHPRLLPALAEECRGASERAQLLVTTHSPFFLDEIRPKEVRVLYRNEDGFTVAKRVSDISGIPEFIEAGGKLGSLWMEGHFNVGDPLINAGAPRLTTKHSNAG